MKTFAILFTAFCAVLSGLLGWVLLFGALGGNLWALAGLVFGIATSLVVSAVLHDRASGR
jgi:hypothetical protein